MESRIINKGGSHLGMIWCEVMNHEEYLNESG